MVHTTTESEVQLAIAVVKTLVLVTGGTIAYLAYKAYRRTGDESLRLLGVGFGLVVAGVLLAGFTYEILMVSLGVGILLESVFVLVGLLVIAYSLRIP